MNTGSACRYRAVFTGAMNVSVGSITSSPVVTPARRSATWRAAVPEDIATACADPVNAANSFSNRVTKEPTDDTHPVSRHSLMYSHSLPCIDGIDNGINSDTVLPRFVILHRRLQPFRCFREPLFQ